MNSRQRTYKLALIGFGAANILFAGYAIHTLHINPRDILIVDPYHDGGALMRRWSHVVSNTTYGQFTAALADLGIPLPAESRQLDPTKPTLLKVLVHQLLEAVPLPGARRIFARTHTIKWAAEANQWEIATTAGNFKAHFISFAPGAEPKCLQTAVPQIPLEHALATDTLRTYFTGEPERPAAGSHVTVFGTAHSGVLIVDALVRLGATVTLVYNTPVPFYYADEGAYDGVKQETAMIARAIQADGLAGHVDLIPYSDSLKLHDSLNASRWTVCACGFETANMPVVVADAGELKCDKGIPYNPATGQIAPRLYGWGIAFPSCTIIDGRTYTDVSIPSFAGHILRQADELRAALLYSS
jgi:hypothetical protein